MVAARVFIRHCSCVCVRKRNCNHFFLAIAKDWILYKARSPIREKHSNCRCSESRKHQFCNFDTRTWIIVHRFCRNYIYTASNVWRTHSQNCSDIFPCCKQFDRPDLYKYTFFLLRSESGQTIDEITFTSLKDVGHHRDVLRKTWMPLEISQIIYHICTVLSYNWNTVSVCVT